MSRYLIGMSGDKDKMIEHLLKCESRMLEQLVEIREVALNIPEDLTRKRILELCNVYVDKRSEEEKMFDSLNESMSVLEQRMDELQSVVRAITSRRPTKEGDE